MDLMSSGADFAQLKRKYGGFAAPTLGLRVDGTDLLERMHARVSQVSVELSCGMAASGSSFRVEGEYGFDSSGFRKSGAYSLLQVGARVELELGYIVTEKVFHGLIAQVEYLFSEEGPAIQVTCLDAKCLLMKRQHLELRSGQTVSRVISDLLAQQPFAGYVTGSEVAAIRKTEEMLPIAMQDDFHFLNELAQYYGCEFFISQGKALFREPPASGSAGLTLAPGQGIQDACISLQGAGLYGKAQVVGRNPQEDAAVTGSARLQGRYASGPTASRMVNGSARTYFDYRAQSAQDASNRAKVLMRAAEHSFGRIRCRCLGLPELIPGRMVKLKGLMPEADTGCYLLEARHTLDEGGFYTTFEARFAL